MKSYDEITQALLERRKKHLIEMKRKRKRLICASVSLCCLSLVVLVAFNGWNNVGADVLSPASGQSQKAGENEKNNVGEDVTEKGAVKPDNNRDSTHGSDKSSVKKDETSEDSGEISGETEDATVYNTTGTSKQNPKNHGGDNKVLLTTESASDEWGRCVEKIVINRLPDKKVYYVGDELSTSGIVVTAYYDNGDMEDVSEWVTYTFDYVMRPSPDYTVYIEYVDSHTCLVDTSFSVVALEPDISVSESNLVLEAGQSGTLSATTQATGCTVSWHTTDPDVVTVDENGNVAAVGEGTASVYAKVSYIDSRGYCHYEKNSSYCTVTVGNPQ